MIEASARVVSCDEEFAIVETESKAACGSCSSKQSCGGSVLAGLFKRRRPLLKVVNPIQATPGQKVVIGLQEQALVTASLTTYLLPVVCLVLCAIAGQQLAEVWHWSHAELSSILGGLLGLIMGFVLLTRISRHRRSDPAFQTVILRREMEHPVRMSYPNKQ